MIGEELLETEQSSAGSGRDGYQYNFGLSYFAEIQIQADYSDVNIDLDQFAGFVAY